MRTAGSLRSIRRTLAAKAFAAMLVLLVVAPFTAPFSTIDVVELISGTGHGDASAAKTADDAMFAVAPPDPFVALVQPLIEAETAPGSIHLQHLRTIVLRL